MLVGWFAFLVVSKRNIPAVGIVLATVLCLADILPMTFEFDPGAEAFPNICPLGPWVMIFGSFGIILGLLLSPYCPRCKPSDMCFIDAACVHQTDPNLMKRGIHGIGGFLLVSKELRIIWSPVYLTRLWCAPCPNVRGRCSDMHHVVENLSRRINTKLSFLP